MTDGIGRIFGGNNYGLCGSKNKEKEMDLKGQIK